MEKDEAYVPKTRSDLGIPADATEHDVHELLGDTPIYSLFMLIRQQIFAFDAYLGRASQLSQTVLQLTRCSLQCFRTNALPKGNQPLQSCVLAIVL